jgi:hypothetical protein
LNDLVRRMAQGDFDYDILNYYVSSRVAYQSDYSPYYRSYDDECYRFSCSSYYGSPFSLSIVFGRPYRHYYYDPYYYAYSPFYNPFFYDPYYYGSVFRPRYVYPYPGYYGYSRYYDNRYRTYAQPYTPYRFRGADGSNVGFRDRYGPTRWVNTVYNRPISPIRAPATATPRRLTSAPVGSAASPGLVDGPRLKGRPVEARRVRDPDGRDNAPRADNSRQREPRLVRREVDAQRAGQRDESGSRGSGSQPRDGGRSEPVREERRPVERTPSRQASPSREPERAPAREARPERREVDRSSAPRSQSGGADHGSGGGGVRRR